MFEIRFDQSQDVLVIRYSGRVGPDETERCVKEVRTALTKIKPGFRLLVDLTELESMDVSCASQIRNIMEICNESGVAHVVRVIPNPKQDIGLQIMSYFHYRNDVRIVTCPSAEEALEILAN